MYSFAHLSNSPGSTNAKLEPSEFVQYLMLCNSKYVKKRVFIRNKCNNRPKQYVTRQTSQRLEQPRQLSKT